MEEIKEFTPDANLLELAESFSKNYLTLSCGAFRDNGCKYNIEYKDILLKINSSEESKIDVRVSKKSGLIEISKSKLSSPNYTSDYVFYIIIWCVIRKGVDTEQEADLIALKYYLTTKRSIKNVLNGITECFKNSMHHNKDRYKHITNYLITKST